MNIEHYKKHYWREESFFSRTPFTPEEGLERIHGICRCEGKYDCDCVSVVNRAHVELWSEHNEKARGVS
jgi:hypothetical protein